MQLEKQKEKPAPPPKDKEKEHVKEKERKHHAAPKDKGHAKRKDMKLPSPSRLNGKGLWETLKDTFLAFIHHLLQFDFLSGTTTEKDVKLLFTRDRDIAKEKVKPLPAVKEKEKVASKPKEVKPPVAQKQKDIEQAKEKPAAVMTKKESVIKKEGSLAKTAPKMVKEAKEPARSAATDKKAEDKPPKHVAVKKEKAVSYPKPVKPKPTKQEAVKHQKEVPETKPAKSKEAKPKQAEITVTDKKKAKPPVKDKDGKAVGMKTHLKEEKAKVPAVKESHQHRNVTTDKISKAAKTATRYPEIISTKKEKTAVRYYQCVFVNGYNGYTSEYAVTPAQDNKRKAGQSKESGHKIKTPKQ
ncbi:hypothetical protein lerEdw1_005568 [Lerista edwardsae]|nr:hypothetical protein lerEdw1_005568 [Lerista edwardsae]